MTNIDVQAVVAQTDALEQKRSKFKAIGIACGLGAIFPFWTAIFGPLFFFAWLAALICGFVFRGVAVRARDEAMRLRLSIANLPGSPYNSTNFETKVAAPSVWEDSAPAPTAPATPSPKVAAKPGAQTTASRLDKARRRSE